MMHEHNVHSLKCTYYKLIYEHLHALVHTCKIANKIIRYLYNYKCSSLTL